MSSTQPANRSLSPMTNQPKKEPKLNKKRIALGIAAITTLALLGTVLALHFTGNLHMAAMRPEAANASQAMQRNWHWLAIGGTVTLLVIATAVGGIVYHRHHNKKSPDLTDPRSESVWK